MSTLTMAQIGQLYEQADHYQKDHPRLAFNKAEFTDALDAHDVEQRLKVLDDLQSLLDSFKTSDWPSSTQAPLNKVQAFVLAARDAIVAGE